MGLYAWACNTRARPDRARKYLGYEPSVPSLWDTLEDDLLTTVEYVKLNGPTYVPGGLEFERRLDKYDADAGYLRGCP